MLFEYVDFGLFGRVSRYVICDIISKCSCIIVCEGIWECGSHGPF